jgi:hypothetical protein
MKKFQIIFSAFIILFYQISSNALILDEKYDNKIHIKIDNSEVKNFSFYIIFSSKPLVGSNGKLKENISIAELQNYERNGNEDLLVLNLRSDKTKKGWCDIYFGGKNDPDKTYASKWMKYSDEIWDNVSIAYEKDKKFNIVDVIIIRGGRTLFDSTKKKSYPNNNPVDFSILEQNSQKTDRGLNFLNLSLKMEKFRKDYYELKGDFLYEAYSDLGQTNGLKFSKVDKSWCSEFPAYIYRENGFYLPNPYISGVWAGSLRSYFLKQGKVFTFRELSIMSDADKIKNILPGSIICREGHTYLFTTWVLNEKPMNRYTAISGNNRGMVWAHTIHDLNNENFYKNKTEKEHADLDQKDFFAVPLYFDKESYSTKKEKEERLKKYSVLPENSIPFILINGKSFLTADVSGKSKKDGSLIIQYKFNSAKNQFWRLEPYQNKAYRIISLNSGKAVSYVKNKDGIFDIVQMTISDNSNQLWNFEKIDTGVYKIRNERNFYLSVKNSSSDKGAGLVLSENSNEKSLMWIIDFPDFR